MKYKYRKENLSHRLTKNVVQSSPFILLLMSNQQGGKHDNSSKDRNGDGNEKGKLLPYLMPLVTLLGILVSVASTTYWNYKQERNNQLIQQTHFIYGEIHDIQAHTASQKKLANRLNMAMNNLIVLRTVSQRNCDQGSESNHDYQNRYLARSKIIDLNYEVKASLGQRIYNETQNFIKLDSHDASICSKDSPKEQPLRLLQGKINDEMLKVEYANKMEIAMLKQKVTLLF